MKHEMEKHGLAAFRHSGLAQEKTYVVFVSVFHRVSFLWIIHLTVLFSSICVYLGWPLTQPLP